ncbi:MAG: tetratricopeptide repeat protein [Halobacteriota archaeon]
MLERDDLVNLQDELNQNIVFRTLEKELYDFAHASLREYCRDKLPEGEKVKLHSKAARCIESLKDKLPERYVYFSLADHLFLGQEYKKALELNLRLGSLLYALFDYTTALRLTEQAEICAGKANDRYALAAALHQKGMILHDLGRFSASLDSYNQSLNIYRKKLLDSDPSNVNSQSDVAMTSNNIGTLLAGMGKRDEAREYYKNALATFEDLKDAERASIVKGKIAMLQEASYKKWWQFWKK